MIIGFTFTNYNNSHYTLSFVESIINANGFNSTDHKIVIVDNSLSELETQKLNLIIEKYPFIDLVTSKSNLGYFGGLNKGIEYIRTHYKNITNIVIGNNDLSIPSDFFNSLANISFLMSKYPVICPDIITFDNVHQNPHVKDKVLFYKHLLLDLYYSNYYLGKFLMLLKRIITNFIQKKPLDHTYDGEILQGYGACYILSSVFFDHFDFLDSPTFLMGEEAFLTLQISKLGFYPYYTNKVKIFHLDHASVSKMEPFHFWKISSNSHKIYRKLIPSNWKKV